MLFHNYYVSLLSQNIEGTKKAGDNPSPNCLPFQVVTQNKKPFENVVEKGENAECKHFSSPTMFSILQKINLNILARI